MFGEAPLGLPYGRQEEAAVEALALRLSLASKGQLPGAPPALSTPESPLLSILSFCEQNQRVRGSQCEEDTRVFLSLHEWMDMLTGAER